MLSREANAVYWMCRYLERAENIARFIEVNGHLMLDMPTDPVSHWGALVQTTGDEELFHEHYDAYDRESVIEFLTFNRDNPNSIVNCLNFARENAKTVRAVISSEMWERINTFYLMVSTARLKRVLEEPYLFYTEVKQTNHLINGIQNATMSHGEPWHFCRLGELLERADKTSRILDVKYFILLPRLEDVNSPFDNLQWSAVLKSASALEMFRKIHGSVSPSAVADFLILDSDFPRSLAFCLDRAQDSLTFITGRREGEHLNAAERTLGRLCSRMEFTTIQEIISGGLHEFLDEFQTSLNEVDASMYDTFFAVRDISTDVAIL